MKSEQLEAAREFVKGQDVFVSLPTGSGKSLCYACLLYTTLCAAIGDIGRRVENGDFSLVFMNPEALVSSCR